MGSLGSALLLSGRFRPQVAPRELRIVVFLPAHGGVIPPTVSDISAGASLAWTESMRAGLLFGQVLQLVAYRTDPSEEPHTAQHLITSSRATMIVGGMSEPECLLLSGIAEERGLVFFNVGASADSLRRDGCRRHTFHVAASEAMIRAARAASGQAGNPPATIELWHESLERYGGSQLNDRFRARSARPMTSSAWAGWVAVKIAWETSLRAQSVEPEQLLAVLDNDTTQFDGHKGAPLSFREWDHQLRQPQYAVDGGKVVAELPDVGRNTNQPMKEQLDRFGDSGRTTMCVERR